MMISSRLFNSTPFSIISVNNKKNFSSSHYPTATAIQSIKSEVSMDSMPKTSDTFLCKKPYSPPSWAANLNPIPSHVFSLGQVCSFFSRVELIECIFLFSFGVQFPTPIHKWNLPNLPKGTEVYLKVTAILDFLVVIESIIELF